MAGPRQRPATYQDLLDAPEGQRAELILGSLVLHPQPSGRHQAGSTVLSSIISGPFHRGSGGPGGWWIVYEPETHLGENVLVPDLAGWLRERMPALPDDHIFDVTPDWICEVLSPSTEIRDRCEKAEIYAAAGVSFLWLLDPDAPLLEAYENQRGKWLRHAAFGPDDEVVAPPFGEAPFVLKTLWE